MKAVGVMAFGGPEELHVLELPSPEPSAREVRIRVYAAAVNPTDLIFRSGGQAWLIGRRRPPFVPGTDVAGVIDQLGADANHRLAVGDRVIALVPASGSHGGAYAEQIVAPAASVVHAPYKLDFPAASTLLLSALTARLALDALALRPGQRLAVTGAAGAVGGFAIQLAKADSIHVVADAAPSDLTRVQHLGADIIVRRGDEVARAIRAAVPDGVHGLVDASGQEGMVLPAVVDAGALAVLNGWPGPTERKIILRTIHSRAAVRDTAVLERLVEQAESGVLTLTVADVVRPEEAVDAHRRVAAGGVRGRIVLDFSPEL
jgi:NADPH:quinone reductase